MRRSLIPIIAASLLLLPATPSLAASPAEPVDLCIRVTGADQPVTPDSLEQGITDGTITVASVEACDQGSQTTTTNPPATADDPGDMGNWDPGTVTTDAITDAEQIVAILLSDESDDVALGIGCNSGNLGVMIIWDGYVGSDGVEVVTRVDGADPVTQEWSSSDQGTYLLFGDAKTFFDDLRHAERLVARTESILEDTMTATFTLHGIGAGTAKVRDACTID
ncbi:MAG: hypothetical protein U0667_05735 [Chloroflexota bacterium]